ncbi:hypothetical protein Tco_0553606 [Tanacetum coccineum]
MCDDDEEGREPLEFIPWRNSKFKDHKKVDETTKRGLLYTWIEIRKDEGLLNDEVSNNEEWEEHEYENPPNDSFPKPYFKIHKNKNNGEAYNSSGTIRHILGFGIQSIYPCTVDLAEAIIWYMLKKTCVELIRAC